MAIRAITGAVKTAPTAAIEYLLFIPPLHFHVEAVAMSAICRSRALGMIREREFANYSARSEFIGTSEEMKSEQVLHMFHFERKFEVLIPSRVDWEDGKVRGFVYRWL